MYPTLNEDTYYSSDGGGGRIDVVDKKDFPKHLISILPPLNPHRILPKAEFLYSPLQIDGRSVETRRKTALQVLLANLPSSSNVDYAIANNQNLDIKISVLTKRILKVMNNLLTEPTGELVEGFTQGLVLLKTTRDAKDILIQDYIHNYTLFRCLNYLITGFPVYDPTTDTKAPAIIKNFSSTLLEIMTEYTKADRDILAQRAKIAEQSLHLDYKIYTKELVSYKLDLMKQLKRQIKELGEEANKITNPDILYGFDMPPLIPIATIPSEEPLEWHYAIKD
jgi:hypothetical protein